MCVLLAAGQALYGADERYRLLADTEGQLGSVVLAVNSARRAALRNAGLVSNIVNGLPEILQVNILANDLAAFTVANNPWPGRIHFIEVPASNPITIWTQDPFLVLRDEAGKTLLLKSREFERAGDSLLADVLGEFAGYPLRRSALFFEGGNVVSDSDYVFIGANTIRYNAVKLGQPEEEVVVAFQEELGRPVLVVGPFPQPVAHIDMMLTPLGDGRLALADPGAGADMAERALANQPESVAAFEDFCEQTFFGHPAIGQISASQGQLIRPPSLSGHTREMAVRSREIAPVLDGIAAAMAGFGYEVVRIPWLYGGPEISLADEETGSAPSAAYPMLTYNNVLIERTTQTERVYLPRYGWSAMDQAAEKAWRDLGFETTAIEGLTTSAMYGGALRCSVKVLKRN
ncbi:hypothetical protein F3N42_00495 [Marinihelvus fidelis]|uniref:Amidinotransferase n=1 Tax=Marinihelvus fidelis TaxID=2613842 RepID=A0A5N0THX7_9GAMM|nr:hypothetical protein [Marinihelvus fidelis]KAA9134064.1 hypothetical protein F3N42_00495 [Marinihelvus fidelis]